MGEEGRPSPQCATGTLLGTEGVETQQVGEPEVSAAWFSCGTVLCSTVTGSARPCAEAGVLGQVN